MRRRSITRIMLWSLGTLPITVNAATSSGGLFNVTVDDSGSDPLTGNAVTYTGNWNTGQDCNMCSAQPDRMKMHNNSWHDTTYDASDKTKATVSVASFSFTGSAIYVYGTLSLDGVKDFTSDTYLEFVIDGTPSGYFFNSTHHINAYTYDVLFFSADSLPYKPHTMEILNGQEGGPSSLLLFDYLVYTAHGGEASGIDAIPNVSTTVSQARSSTSTSPSQTSVPMQGSSASMNTAPISVLIAFGALLGLLGISCHV